MLPHFLRLIITAFASSPHGPVLKCRSQGLLVLSKSSRLHLQLSTYLCTRTLSTFLHIYVQCLRAHAYLCTVSTCPMSMHIYVNCLHFCISMYSVYISAYLCFFLHASMSSYLLYCTLYSVHDNLTLLRLWLCFTKVMFSTSVHWSDILCCHGV